MVVGVSLAVRVLRADSPPTTNRQLRGCFGGPFFMASRNCVAGLSRFNSALTKRLLDYGDTEQQTEPLACWQVGIEPRLQGWQLSG